MTDAAPRIHARGGSWPLRDEVFPSDLDAIKKLVAATGVFHDFEVDIAVELVEERLRRGDPSGYHFLLADGNDGADSELSGDAGVPAGYTCWGPIPCTQGSYDIYWIAVNPKLQGQGLGQALMQETERRIVAAGGRRIYLETSGRPDYLPTRRFYDRCGYEVVATIANFYAEGDDKVVYAKVLT